MLQLLFILSLLTAFSAAAQSRRIAPPPGQVHKPSIIFWRTSPESVALLLRSVPQTDAIRLAQLKQTFTDLECKAPWLDERPVPAGGNLVCTLPAAPEAAPKEANNGTILLLANYEHEGQGRSAVENWSGALMLPFLYHALSAAPPRHTFLFVEVDGERGAAALFDSFTLSQRRQILGVIALDALGLGPIRLYINPNDSSSRMAWTQLARPLLQATADQLLPAPAETLPPSWSKIDVTRHFRHHGIPSILVHSVQWSARDMPGSTRDTEAAINRKNYMQEINLLADYAVELDRSLPSFHRPIEGRNRP